ncbi:MAG: response regulator [Acidobacteria bacterium]|nr:response regulator [Acidobacteriota bacterium]MBI3663023.1 response regulator [Acidobacteriota bacterium]
MSNTLIGAATEVDRDTLPKILVVDDEHGMRSFLLHALEPFAQRVSEAENPHQALAALEDGDFDLVISDWYMPGASGMELLELAKKSHWDVGFILMTGEPDVHQVIAAVRMQAFDFLIKPFTIPALSEAVARSYQRLQRERESRAYRELLEAGLQKRTRELEAALRGAESNYKATLEALVAALDARERETFSHSLRVRAYATYLARLAGYPSSLMPHLEQGALLHDIGKIAVADAILLKPGELTPEEWVEMKKHPEAGEQIVRRVSFLSGAASIIRNHHERFDGTGYPDGLAGDDIPLGARIFAFADTMDAMTTDRPYRAALSMDMVREEVRCCIGSQFDPRIAEAFLRVPEETWKQLRQKVESRTTAMLGD